MWMGKTEEKKERRDEGRKGKGTRRTERMKERNRRNMKYEGGKGKGTRMEGREKERKE